MRLVLLGFGVDSQDGIVRGEGLGTSMNVVVVREPGARSTATQTRRSRAEMNSECWDEDLEEIDLNAWASEGARPVCGRQ
jgi:hypothetical protein